MIKTFVLHLIIFSFLNAGEISLSISENLINEYLELIGEYKNISKKDNSIQWLIQKPHVKLNNNEAIFFAKAIYKNGLINIKKNIKLLLKIKYNLKKNEINLIFENSIIKMERRGILLSKLDIKKIYEPKLIFNGPNLKNKKFTINFKNKRKIYIKPNFAEISIENKKIELILNISFKEKNK